MQVSHKMKELINNIIIENVPDAKCTFDGDLCNLKLIVSSKFCLLYTSDAADDA